MTAPWYTPSGTPATNAQGSSSDMRSEFDLVETALDKLPALTANKVIAVNSGGTALEAVSSGLALTSPVFTTPQIEDTSADNQYIFAVSELTSDRTVTLPLLTGNDEFVFKDHAVTLTNKTLTSPVLTTPQINDTSSDHQYVFAPSELTSDRTVTLPLLTTNDEFVFKTHAVTLANKTLTSPVINTSVSGSAFLDEDDMSSDSDSKFASQQSIKAYVDGLLLILDSATPKTSGFNAVAGKYYLVNTEGGAFTCTFPASPSAGDTVGIIDVNGTFHTDNLTLGRNSSNVMRSAEDGTIDSRNWTTAWVYTDASNGWLPRGF